MSSIRSYKGVLPTLNERVYIDNSSVLVGDITIESDSSIWPLVAARGDVNHIRIGARTNIQDGSVLHVTHKNSHNPNGYPLLIGNDVTIGHKVMLHGCTIHDRVLVGMGSIILDGAIIESEVMIGAGSLVPPGKTLVSSYLYVGSPVKQARKLTEAERQFLLQSASNYVQTKNEYLAEPSQL
ncbi:gamma carbonic anhydrase family protein [Vibrio sp. A11]|uniref:gamma carbonic anhydrase family protein n=1 Tax=unclassified Vibrio TaxID=2614977 RepID=UPI0014826E97|nr:MULTISPECIES: gamma carbonic anhydrase family protein [unclassified Vibrio]EKO3593455.1 gamma carbonic anhydrase family protein [Vibrio metschnikovii]EKO3666779.1 gamma carbonic anhydrase family protein [Vibrio metschnikovii]EKO3698190.1 gamma carbonic anhydrase family protein [Vibrio metschnikovii]NNN62033.1 gamma carbonic anhydrase family protein [Vibrio sp. A11]NNN84317.1 gamma carbonic anhydrase family protein [Vibrio sp. A8-1]